MWPEMLLNFQKWQNKTFHKVSFLSLIIKSGNVISIYYMIDATSG